MSLEKIIPVLKKFRWATIAVGVAVFCLLLLLFRIGEMNQLEIDVTQSSEQLDRMNRNLTNTRELEQQVGKIEELTDVLDRRIIQPGDAAINISYFYGFENDKVNITSIIQGRRANEGPWKMEKFSPVLFTMEARGDFHSLLDLAYRIRQGTKLVRILSINISPDESALTSRRRATIVWEALGASTE